MPIYRAAHRQTATATAIRIRAPRGQRTMAEELARPDVLAAAIELDQLRLFYHPIVDLAGTTVVGHEVLIRWQHPDFGLLAPADFLPAIDGDDTLSRTLGAWILRRSCDAAMQRGDQLLLAVNIALRHLTEPGFAEHVTQILHVTGFSPMRLVLELSEASMQHSSESTIATCVALADLGVTLALDDIGIGGVKAQSLDELPVGFLKIARSVVAGIGVDPIAEQTIQDTIALATATGRRTIAVGVESHDQARFLREHEVNLAEGYLYGRPQPR